MLEFTYWRDALVSLFKQPSIWRMDSLVSALALFAVLFLFVSLFVIGPSPNWGVAASRGAVVLLLGFSSTAFALLLHYKFLLYIGVPTLALLIGQALPLMFAWWGAMRSSRLSHRRKIVVGAWIYGVLLLALPFFDMSKTMSWLFQPSGLLLLSVVAAPMPFLSAYLFSQTMKAVKEVSSQSIPWFLGMNLMSGATAAMFVPLAAENMGFNGCLCACLSPF